MTVQALINHYHSEDTKQYPEYILHALLLPCPRQIQFFLTIFDECVLGGGLEFYKKALLRTEGRWHTIARMHVSRGPQHWT